MKALKITIIVVAILGVIFAGGLWMVGWFSKIEIKEQNVGGYLLAGLDFTGPYMNVGPTMQLVDSALRKSGIECKKGFGIYYDDPKTTPKEKCRSFVGNIIENPNGAIVSGIESIGLKVYNLPVNPSSVIEWEVKNPISYMIGPMKAYPAFTEYLKDKTFKPDIFIEIYDVPAKKVYYVMQHH